MVLYDINVLKKVILCMDMLVVFNRVFAYAFIAKFFAFIGVF